MAAPMAAPTAAPDMWSFLNDPLCLAILGSPLLVLGILPRVYGLYRMFSGSCYSRFHDDQEATTYRRYEKFESPGIPELWYGYFTGTDDLKGGNPDAERNCDLGVGCREIIFPVPEVMEQKFDHVGDRRGFREGLPMEEWEGFEEEKIEPFVRKNVCPVPPGEKEKFPTYWYEQFFLNFELSDGLFYIGWDLLLYAAIAQGLFPYFFFLSLILSTCGYTTLLLLECSFLQRTFTEDVHDWPDTASQGSQGSQGSKGPGGWPGEAIRGIVAIVAKDVYMCLTSSLNSVAFVFLSQLLLAGYLAQALFDSAENLMTRTELSWWVPFSDLGNSDDPPFKKGFPWWAPVLLQVLSSQPSQNAGEGFIPQIDAWAHILLALVEFPQWCSSAESIKPMMGFNDESYEALRSYNRSRKSFLKRCIRAGMSLVQNGVIYNMILLYVPVLLMASEKPVDFVKDSFAVIFILALDTLSIPATIYIYGPIWYIRDKVREVPVPQVVIRGPESEWDHVMKRPSQRPQPQLQPQPQSQPSAVATNHTRSRSQGQPQPQSQPSAGAVSPGVLPVPPVEPMLTPPVTKQPKKQPNPMKRKNTEGYSRLAQ